VTPTVLTLQTGHPTDLVAMLQQLQRELPRRVLQARLTHRLSLSQAGHQIGISPSVVARVETAGDYSLTSAVAVLRWLSATEATP
jgi:DNA-directed RNA polymerase specialized sigma subunit